jgi:hypothetical protein
MKHAAEIVRRARNGRGAERRDPVARKQRRDARDCTFAVESIVPVKTVHVHIDEARRDKAVTRVDDCCAFRIDAARFDSHDSAGVDDQ